MSLATELRRRLDEPGAVVVPGAADALTARLIQEAGFPAVYATGAGFANTSFGFPDVGLVSSTEVFGNVARIADSVNLPVIVDADTGYGEVLQVRRTVRELERAGAAAVQLEDQVTAKRCGHFEGQQLISEADMCRKVEMAVDSRRDQDIVVIARTDARGVEGFDAAVARARAYVGAGADLIFFEAPRTVEEVEVLPGLIGAPMLVNMVEGGKTPLLSASQLEGFGYKIILYANTALRASMAAVRDAMRVLRRDGDSSALLDEIVSWEYRQQIVDLTGYQELEDRYSSDRVAEGVEPPQ